MLNTNVLLQMREKLLQGAFKDKNYLTQFSPINIQNPLKLWCIYKSSSNVVPEWKDVDCDVSLAAVVTYALMYEWLNEGQDALCTIQLQTKESSKYEILSKKGNIYKGDTMTSVQTVFKEYLKFLWKSDEVSIEFKQLFEILPKDKLTIPKDRDKPAYENLFDYIMDKVISDEKFLNIIDKEISDESRSFLSNSFKSGNYQMVTPGFNASRSHKGVLDTADKMLWQIYQYFKTQDDAYLYSLFIDADGYEKTVVNNFKIWIMEAKINSWLDFIKDNLMESYVDMNSVEKTPISLKTGLVIPADTVDYNPMPQSLEECETFFSTVNQSINNRNILIYERCLANSMKK